MNNNLKESEHLSLLYGILLTALTFVIIRTSSSFYYLISIIGNLEFFSYKRLLLFLFGIISIFVISKLLKFSLVTILIIIFITLCLGSLYGTLNFMGALLLGGWR